MPFVTECPKCKVRKEWDEMKSFQRHYQYCGGVAGDKIEGKYEYFIPHKYPSMNQFLGKMQNHTMYRTCKKQWSKWIALHTIGNRPPFPIDQAKIHVEYYFKDNRKRDPDNYTPKLILDPLQESGIIRDDSFQSIELSISAKFKTEKEGVRIIVWPILNQDLNG